MVDLFPELGSKNVRKRRKDDREHLIRMHTMSKLKEYRTHVYQSRIDAKAKAEEEERKRLEEEAKQRRLLADDDDSMADWKEADDDGEWRRRRGCDWRTVCDVLCCCCTDEEDEAEVKKEWERIRRGSLVTTMGIRDAAGARLPHNTCVQ